MEAHNNIIVDRVPPNKKPKWRECDDCHVFFSVMDMAHESLGPQPLAARFCPNCGHELDTVKWPYLAFSREDVICITEEDDDLLEVFAANSTNAEAVTDRFVAARSAEADQACGAAVMSALHDVFFGWLVEIGYADADD